jgi:hypothetical protein
VHWIEGGWVDVPGESVAPDGGRLAPVGGFILVHDEHSEHVQRLQLPIDGRSRQPDPSANLGRPGSRPDRQRAQQRRERHTPCAGPGEPQTVRQQSHYFRPRSTTGGEVLSEARSRATTRTCSGDGAEKGV